MLFRRTRPIFLGISMLCLCAPMILAQASDAKGRAQEILEQTRAALGGDAALNAVTSLSAVGDFRSGSGRSEATGDVQVDVLMPDKVIRTMKWSPVENMKVTTIEAVSGGQVWTDSQERDSGQMSGLRSMGGGMGRGGRGGMGRGGRRSTGAGSNPGSTGDSRGKEIHVAPHLLADTDNQQIASDFACLVAGFLVHLPDASHVGISSANNDAVEGVNADYLKIDIGNGSAIRLAIDRKTHRPVMAAYSIASKPGSDSGTERQDSSQPEITRIEIYFSEYKPVPEKKFGDIWLPYQITKTYNGLTVEDMHFKKIQLNPKIKPKEFEQKHS